ncbi:TlpA family protein disulfide reductase [Stieleria sp. JC731]|uniref:TlpA disulfide reductase family protein n=1 Tax=Pirellulaceae TaxID=2691357 RepID=UPI001E338FCE|nr:TlpA disulfide reductase family protein [Stieleria sp. JC731]MCC9599550.1 TlpA family protein disulfide reductase [Stieleria sp. JC731]
MTAVVFERCRFRGRPLIWVTASLLFLVVGCGKAAKDDNPPTNADSDSPSVSAEMDTVSVPHGDENVSSGPSMEGGMQLPDEPIPTASDAASGTEKANSGGMTLPDLDESSSVSSSPINLQLATWEAVEKHVKSTGKVTVVDLWSTSCIPCLKEFPELVKLNNEMDGKIACVAVSLDYDGRKTKPPESYSDSVTEVLASFGAKFQNFLCQTPSDEVFESMELPSIPAVLIFDAEGKLIKQFVDVGETAGFTYKSHIIPFLETVQG